MSSHSVITSASGCPSTSMSYVDGTPRWCSTLSAVDALPWGSRSMTSTFWPSWARPAATLTVDVVLPTPPFWLATTKTRVACGRGMPCASQAAGAGQDRVLGGLRQRRGVVVVRRLLLGDVRGRAYLPGGSRFT